MGKELLTERGSAGIDMILWSLLLLIFIAMPLICGIFELYTYTLYGVKWSGAVENVLDQEEWQLETESLSECDRKLLVEDSRFVLGEACENLSNENQGEDWFIEKLEYLEGEPPKIVVCLRVEYEPVTAVGDFICQGDKMKIRLQRQREFPVDR